MCKTFDSAEFLRGMRDCEEGVPHKDQGEFYNRGYRAEYEMQAARDYISEACHGTQQY